MEFSINQHTIKSGWSIIYIEESQVIISKKKIVFLSLKIDFGLANSANPDEMQHFIWVFIVIQITHSGVFSPQRVKIFMIARRNPSFLALTILLSVLPYK